MGCRGSKRAEVEADELGSPSECRKWDESDSDGYATPDDDDACFEHWGTVSDEAVPEEAGVFRLPEWVSPELVAAHQFVPASPAEYDAVTEIRQRLDGYRGPDTDPDRILEPPNNAILRFLRGNKHETDKACARLIKHLKWRREECAWMRRGCRWCTEKPGFHTWRQIGHDVFGRPVVYSCFEQAGHLDYTGEDAVNHLVYQVTHSR